MWTLYYIMGLIFPYMVSINNRISYLHHQLALQNASQPNYVENNSELLALLKRRNMLYENMRDMGYH